MYLLQRLIGVSIYAICAMFFYFAISKVKGTRLHLNVYNFLLALMGFFYVPMNGSDLGRIQLAMNLYSKMSWSEIIHEMSKSSTPIGIVYYHIIGSFNDNRLLPFINALLTYFLCFTILKLCHKKFNMKRADVALILLFFMSRGLLIMTIANIRTMLALAIIGFAIYKVSVEKKMLFVYLILMLVGGLIHNVGAVAVIIYLIFYMIRFNDKDSLLLVVFELSIIAIIGFYFGRPYIQKVVEKGFNYLDYSKQGVGFFYFWELILSILVLSVTLICILHYLGSVKNLKRKNPNINYTELKLVEFVFLLSILSFFFLFIEFNSGLRMSWLISILNIPLFSIILSNSNLNITDKKRLRLIIFISSILILFIASARGDLCSLKFS